MLLREPIPPLLPTFRQFDRYSAIVGSSLLSSSFPQRPMKKNVTIQTGCFPKIPPFPIFPFPLKRSGIDQDSNVLFPYVRNSSKPSNYSDRSIRRRKGRKKYRNRSSSSPPKKFLLVTFSSSSTQCQRRNLISREEKTILLERRGCFAPDGTDPRIILVRLREERKRGGSWAKPTLPFPILSYHVARSLFEEI